MKKHDIFQYKMFRLAILIMPLPLTLGYCLI